MSDSDSSGLSSPPPENEDNPFTLSSKGGITKFFSKATPKTSSPSVINPKKRPASPPHEYVLADNQDIPFIVMFASRFYECLPKTLHSFGPQDLEQAAVESIPGDLLESLLCTLLSLVLNRKKPVERKHYQRALEEAIHSHVSQWPRSWEKQNPLRGGKTFTDMDPSERLHLLKALVLWSLSSSELVRGTITASYKQVRHEDDLNQPLSVQPWGEDGDKRRYWLVEGREDTHFRLYRESNRKLKNNTWWSVAGTIDELKMVSARLDEEDSQAARRLSDRILLAIPRLEMTQEKRKRREYRLARKAQFVRPEPGFSLYEGRTRGKKMKYTFSSEDEDDDDDAGPVTKRRRSSRQSGVSTASMGSEPAVFTASGRQVKPRMGGVYGEKMHSGQTRGVTPAASVASFVVENGTNGANGTVQQSETSGRTRRSGLRQSIATGGEHIPGYNEVDEMDDEEEAASSGVDDEADDKDGDYGDESAVDEMTDDDMDFEEELDEITGLPRSLIVILKYRPDLLELLPPSHPLRVLKMKSTSINGDSTTTTTVQEDPQERMVNGDNNNNINHPPATDATLQPLYGKDAATEHLQSTPVTATAVGVTLS
ncbi:MAG: hypothetical protein M1823_005206 [Watsoniomyces obsoletus]|nr:MAG: hypothetical protein M1823_005206 [Watsoniomyces obsoletus]